MGNRDEQTWCEVKISPRQPSVIFGYNIRPSRCVPWRSCLPASVDHRSTCRASRNVIVKVLFLAHWAHCMENRLTIPIPTAHRQCVVTYSVMQRLGNALVSQLLRKPSLCEYFIPILLNEPEGRRGPDGFRSRAQNSLFKIRSCITGFA